jgi:hypothetical protein
MGKLSAARAAPVPGVTIEGGRLTEKSRPRSSLRDEADRSSTSV